MEKLLIVDGNSILNRAFFGIRPLSTKSGLPTNAVWGFLTILLKHIETLSPTCGAVAFDLSAPTFRHRMYEYYKAGRHKMPDELRAQLPYAKQCAAALGFSVVEREGWEADDILGTLSDVGAKAGADVFLLTGDRDSLQLISDRVTVLLAGNSDTETCDGVWFTDRYGIRPEQFVDVKALMGDSSDNIPGVSGIGEKTALKLIGVCRSLDGVYAPDNRLEFVGKSIRARLQNGRYTAYLSRQLAQIARNVPLGLTMDDLRFKPDKPEQYRLLTELEFTSLVRRLELQPPAEAEAVTLTGDEAAALPAGEYGVDLQGDVLFLSDGDTLWKTAFDGAAAAFFADPSHAVTAADVKKLTTALDRFGVTIAGETFDLGLCAYVLDSNDGSRDLARLAAAYLGSPASGSSAAPCCAALKETLLGRLSPEEKDLLDTLEVPLSRVLRDMERTGFLVDRAGLQSYGATLSEKADELAEDIFAMAGEEFNLNSPKQLGEILFNKLELPKTQKTKTGYSTSADALEGLKMFPIVSQLLEWRAVSKLKSTYCDGLLAAADAEGRIHTTFNQTVTATGRLSSAEPNLQNIPIKTEMGRELRRYFLPRKGCVLIDADYSQIELRLLAAIAEDPLMTEAFLRGDDIHTITASQVFGVPPENVTPELRKRAKAVNFGIIYGMSDYSLSGDIGVSRWQAGEYIRTYLERYAGVSAYMKRTVEQAKADGYVTTLFGRRRYIPELTSGKAALRAFGERVAMNSPIQGTAADIIKMAMLGTARALKEEGLDARMILQVHDELVLEASRGDAERAAVILRREMEHAVTLSVPLTVELTTGENWYI